VKGNALAGRRFPPSFEGPVLFRARASAVRATARVLDPRAGHSSRQAESTGFSTTEESAGPGRHTQGAAKGKPRSPSSLSRSVRVRSPTLGAREGDPP